jgi:hypothetical protein
MIEQGCGQDIPLFYGDINYKVKCGEVNPISKEVIFCNSCEKKFKMKEEICECGHKQHNVFGLCIDDENCNCKGFKPRLLSNPFTETKISEKELKEWEASKKLKPEDFKPIIEVKDYLYAGNIIYGTKDDEEKDSWILDDGDIFTTEELREDYEIRFLTCIELLEEGKQQILNNLHCFQCDKELKKTDYMCCDDCQINMTEEEKEDIKQQTIKLIDEMETDGYNNINRFILKQKLADYFTKDNGEIISEEQMGQRAKGFDLGYNKAKEEFKENLLFTKTNHQLGCMLECYAEVIGNRLGFSIEAIKLEEIASKLK